MASKNGLRATLESTVEFILTIFYFCISLFLALVILFVGGWIFKVLFGNMTTSDYFHQWSSYLLHPDKTAAGVWLKQTLDRIKR